MAWHLAHHFSSIAPHSSLRLVRRLPTSVLPRAAIGQLLPWRALLRVSSVRVFLAVQRTLLLRLGSFVLVRGATLDIDCFPWEAWRLLSIQFCFRAIGNPLIDDVHIHGNGNVEVRYFGHALFSWRLIRKVLVCNLSCDSACRCPTTQSEKRIPPFF